VGKCKTKRLELDFMLFQDKTFLEKDAFGQILKDFISKVECTVDP
jgi:hypothetical protein